MSNTSSNIFKNDNRNYRENRFRPQQQSSNLPSLSPNPFSDNRPRNQYSEFRPQQQRNQFNGSVINQQVAAPPPPRPVVPPIEEFPSLLRSPKVAPVAAAAPIQFAKVAKDAAHIVVQKPKLTQVKPEQQRVVKQEVSTRIRMTLDEYRERKEDGEDLDADDISFCSEYSNHADDSDDDI
jgi:NACalpha-BTF3-like transcription factor